MGSRAIATAPPPGFEIVGSGSVPPPPSGFELVKDAKPKQSLLERAKEAYGRVSRNEDLGPNVRNLDEGPSYGLAMSAAPFAGSAAELAGVAIKGAARGATSSQGGKLALLKRLKEAGSEGVEAAKLHLKYAGVTPPTVGEQGGTAGAVQKFTTKKVPDYKRAPAGESTFKFPQKEPHPERPLAARVEPTPTPIPEPTKLAEPKLPGPRKPPGAAERIARAETPAAKAPSPVHPELEAKAHQIFKKGYDALDKDEKALVDAASRRPGPDVVKTKSAKELQAVPEIKVPEIKAAPSSSGPSIDIQGAPEHYGETGASFGNRMVQHAVSKDATIIKNLSGRGITPEQFEAASESQKNVWLRDVNREMGKKYDPYSGEQGKNSVERLLKLWRWALSNEGGTPPA